MDLRRRKIWITRAEPGAAATATRVRALGHEALVVPLLEVAKLSHDDLDVDQIGALAFTSANGVRAFAELSARRDFRVYAVGSATARAAREAGFRNVLSADGDVVALANGIAARKSDLHGLVLHPGASEPAGDLVGALASHGIEARRLDLYDTLPAALTDDRQTAIAQAEIVLLHSAKAAKVLADVLDTMPAGQLKVLAISEAALRPLERSKLAFKAFAPFPLEAALLNLIDRTP